MHQKSRQPDTTRSGYSGVSRRICPLWLCKLAAFLLVSATLAVAQANEGELRITVLDPTGTAVKTVVHIKSQASHYENALMTNARGEAVAEHLPFGRYEIEVDQPGFAPYAEAIEVQSSIPVRYDLRLALAAVHASVTVSATDTLLDPDRAGAVDQVGGELLQKRLTSLPGRGLQDIVNSEPGWLYEGNAVLHPRGSEYQTQFVVDGIPLTDNRSPSFGPEIEADDVQSVSIYTAGIPAEYGRKMGGVVEVNTEQDSQPGFHGKAVLSGGSFASAGGFAQGQYTWGRNTLGGSANGSRTDHYLNPVVTQNYSNTGTLSDFSLNYRRELTASDKLTLNIRHEQAEYDIPNEMVQQAAGQRQTANNLETMGIAGYQHILSPNATLDLHGMVRDNANNFYSNPESTPVEVFQHNRFREGYFRASVTVNRGRQEWKAGVESDNTFLHENTAYTVTSDDDDNEIKMGFGHRARAADDDEATQFSFQDSRPDLEQSAFVQDLIRLHNWTISAGLRWDHYQLVLNSEAVQPRFSIARYFPSANTILHFSYDRVFQTPSFENILLSSSTQVESIDPGNFLRLPVKPSQGDYYEGGLSTVLAKHVKLDANYFRRFVNDYADDDQIDNTTISFPIAFRKAIIYGAEGKLEVPEWHGFSGFASYSYEVGNAWFPVTGGLFLGADASAAASQLTGHFPDSQDQRNTVRGRARYQVAPRLWLAAGAQYDTGLPFAFDGTPEQVLQEYGQAVLNRINFDRGRIRPSFQVNASMGAEIYRSERMRMTVQADGENLNNLLDVIDFGGLFSGNAIGPPRSFGLRLTTNF